MNVDYLLDGNLMIHRFQARSIICYFPNSHSIRAMISKGSGENLLPHERASPCLALIYRTPNAVQLKQESFHVSSNRSLTSRHERLDAQPPISFLLS